MKAIETKYKGYRFRSRLEARWAVFFDALGLAWEYEKEGYDLNGIKYLPDFWLPGLDCWIEIKGRDVNDDDRDKCGFLAAQSSKRVYMFYGEMVLPDHTYNGWDRNPSEVFFQIEDGVLEAPYGWDAPHQFCQCPDCGSIGIEFDGRSDRLRCKESYGHWAKRTGQKLGPEFKGEFVAGCPRHAANGDKTYTSDTEALYKAYEVAMSARFEHGESG